MHRRAGRPACEKCSCMHGVTLLFHKNDGQSLGAFEGRGMLPKCTLPSLIHHSSRPRELVSQAAEHVMRILPSLSLPRVNFRVVYLFTICFTSDPSHAC